MREINIAESDLAAAMGRGDVTGYMAHVVDAGHQPGALSGAELRGKAKKYGAGYAQTRANVIRAVRQLTGISDGYALVGSRWARVWVDEAGERVELTVKPG